jgi:hypothetical protein
MRKFKLMNNTNRLFCASTEAEFSWDLEGEV